MTKNNKTLKSGVDLKLGDLNQFSKNIKDNPI